MVRMVPITTIIGLVSWKFIALSNAIEFLPSLTPEFHESVGEDSIDGSLLRAVESSLPDSLGTGNHTKRISQVESALRPIYRALPKNEYGNLEHTAARYGLHRLFGLLHGWAITGLGAGGSTYNTSSPATLLNDQVPSYIEELFEQHLDGKGFKLHQLAILASAIEHLIQKEAVGRLGAVFKINQVSLTDALNEREVSDVLDTYMMSYILSENLAEMAHNTSRRLLEEMPEIYQHWAETRDFVRGVRDYVNQNDKQTHHVAGKTDFKALTKVVAEVGEKFGDFFDDTACKNLKATLMRMEYRDTGRVRLSEFYKSAIAPFQESAAYLRELGVLEETDPKEPSVMIANYLVSQSNCVASSRLHSVCCKNECEGLLAYLERNFSAPDAKPAAIAKLAAGLPSSTVGAPRTLSDSLLRRLHEIASSHGGMIPLHGRLFAQWMHHAYPRECPFPHISGTTTPKLPKDWLEETGDDTVASDEEMQQYIQWSTNTIAADVTVEDLMSWSAEEELLVMRHYSDFGQADRMSAAQAPASRRSVMLFAIAGSLGYGLIQAMKATSALGLREAPQKFSI